MRRCLRVLLVLWVVVAVDAHAQVLVSFPAPDGEPIVADLYTSRAAAGDRAVVLAHGGQYDKSGWRKQALIMADAGYRVLAIDFRGADALRRGAPSRCGYNESCLATDIVAAARYLRADGIQTVDVVGASMGAGAAAEAAIQATPGEIHRIVLIANPIERAELLRVPTLFIVARGDLGDADVPRLPAVRASYDKAPVKEKKLVVVEGTAHAQALFETQQSDRVMREILTFLTRR